MTMHNRRVLIFSSCHVFGGSERLMLGQARELSNYYTVDLLGIYPRLVALEIGEQCNGIVRKHFATFIYDRVRFSKKTGIFRFILRILDSLPILWIWNYVLLISKIIAIKPDSVIINSGGMPGAKVNVFFYYAACTVLGHRKITWVCHGIPSRVFLGFKKSLLVVTHSKSNAKILSNRGLKNVISFPSYWSGELAPTISGQKAYDFLMIGFLEVRKGHYDFLTRYKSEIIRRNLKVGIIGDGPEKRRLENLIFENNLKTHVTLLGPRKDYASFMSSAKVIVHPSIGSEDMPLVIIEALARGCVILCSKVAGLSQYLTDGENAVFLKDNIDFQALLNEQFYRQRLAENAIELYKRTFSKEKYIVRWLEVIMERM